MDNKSDGRKLICGNCWKLDRTKDWCERHKVTLKFDGSRRVKVYFQCAECIERKKNKPNHQC